MGPSVIPMLMSVLVGHSAVLGLLLAVLMPSANVGAGRSCGARCRCS